jgi:signal transduction histidine kinase
MKLEGLDADSNLDPQLRDLGAMTGVWLPVSDDEAVRGVLILLRCKLIPFVHADVGLLSAMTHRIGLSLGQAQRSAELQAALSEVRRLNAELEQRVEERTVELRLARDAAETADRAKSAFLAIMGHELRTPLNGIFLAAEMLREADLPPGKQREYADIILTTGRRLLRMVEGVLEYTTINPKLSLGSLDLATAFEDSAAHWRRLADQKHITLTFNLDRRLPRLQADPHQFDKMLRRLIDNAIKFTPEGGQVTVIAELVPAVDAAGGGDSQPALRGGYAVRISVTDTGRGLQPEDCERIFEPFIQLESSYLEHTEGAGLGLTLARRQAQAHGGRLWAESEGQGKGSRFILVLPLP